MHAKSLQSCPTLCDPRDCSLLSSTVHGILQERILEWVAMPFSRGSSQPRDQTQLSYIAGGFFTIWATREAPLKEVLQAKEKYKEMQIQILLLEVGMRALKIVVSIMEF